MGKKIIIKGADFSEYAVGASSAGTKVIVAFDTNGIGSVPYKRVDKGEVLTLPTPSAEGYEFMGWYREQEYSTLIEENLTVSSNITLYAKWQSVETITYQESEWTNGKYRNLTPFTAVGVQLTGTPTSANAARSCTKQFDIPSGATFELVSAIQTPSTALAVYGAMNMTTLLVVIPRDVSANLLNSPLIYTTTEDIRLFVNLGNGLDKTTSEYIEDIDYRDDFYLKIKTPIPYGHSEE